MTESELKAIEKRWAKWINPESAPKTLGGDFLILLAEVRRLNLMVDKATEWLYEWKCPIEDGYTRFVYCTEDDQGDCFECVRKYLESEVGNNG